MDHSTHGVEAPQDNDDKEDKDDHDANEGEGRFRGPVTNNIFSSSPFTRSSQQLAVSS